MEAEWVTIAKDIGIPVAAILVSSGIAIALAVGERKASAKARADEAMRNSAESVLVTLTTFITMDPATEDAVMPLRQLRAGVTVFQTLLRTDEQRIVGGWLAAEARHGVSLFRDAHEMIAKHNVLQNDHIKRSAILEPAHRWAHGVMMRFARWLSGELDGGTFLADMKRLAIEYPEQSD